MGVNDTNAIVSFFYPSYFIWENPVVVGGQLAQNRSKKRLRLCSAVVMATVASLLTVVSAVCLGVVRAEPTFCKRGVKVSEAYQHCFEDAHYKHPYQPLFQSREVLDGCFVEAYANHTCRNVKPAALDCFRRKIRRCDHRERLLAIADESGGACFGNHINRIFKEHVLNFLEPVRSDSKCFVLADRSYECYSKAGHKMSENNPNLKFLSVDEFMNVANEFFDTIYNCYVNIYSSNRPLCENWQIPLLLEIQGTALPSLFGMSFTADQMDKLDLHRGCPVRHLIGVKPYWRTCYDQEEGSSNYTVSSRPSSNHGAAQKKERQRVRQRQREQQQKKQQRQRQRQRQRQKLKKMKQRKGKKQQLQQQKQLKQAGGASSPLLNRLREEVKEKETK